MAHALKEEQRPSQDQRSPVTPIGSESRRIELHSDHRPSRGSPTRLAPLHPLRSKGKERVCHSTLYTSFCRLPADPHTACGVAILKRIRLWAAQAPASIRFEAVHVLPAPVGCTAESNHCRRRKGRKREESSRPDNAAN